MTAASSSFAPSGASVVRVVADADMPIPGQTSLDLPGPSGSGLSWVRNFSTRTTTFRACQPSVVMSRSVSINKIPAPLLVNQLTTTDWDRNGKDWENSGVNFC